MKPTLNSTRIKAALALIGAGLFSAATSQADTHWTAGIADYNNAGNWDAGIPNSAQNAIVSNGGTVLIQSGDPTLQTFDVRAGDGGGSGHWIQDGPAVQCNSWLRIGIGGINATCDYLFKSGTLTSGRFIISDNTTIPCNFTATNTGTITVGGDEVWIGQYDNGKGTLNLGGNVSFTANNWFAPARDNGVGILNVSNNAVLNKLGANAFTVSSVLHNTGGTPTGNGTINQGDFATINVPTVDTWLPEDNIGVWNMWNSCTSIVATLQFGRNLGNNGGLGQGTLNLNGGYLNANQITVGAGTGTLNFNGGALRARGANANFMSGVTGVIKSGGANIDSAGFNIGISSIITDGSPAGSLTKIGNGTLTLLGANTFTGTEVVSAGKLIDGTGTANTANAVTVANTAGYGVSLQAANGQVTRGTLTLNGAAHSLDFLLGGFGNPTYTSGTAALNVNQLVNSGTTTVNISDTAPAVGTIPLIYSTTSTMSLGSFTLGTLPAGVSATLQLSSAGHELDLVVSSTALLRWDGEVAGSIWDTSSVTNWTDYNSPFAADHFTTAAAVYFDDLALGSTTANLNVSVSPGSVTATNNNLAYTIIGTGSINGTGGLTKQGTNSLTIGTTNGYTGATTISAGTLSINSLANGGTPSGIGAASSSSANLVLDGGTLSYTGPATTTDRGFTLTQNSTLDVQANINYNGAINPLFGATLTKTGQGNITITNSGIHPLSNGGGTAALDLQGGTLLLDGSAPGGQTNNVNGEIWVGGTANATNTTMIVTNTTLNMSSWLAIARGSGTMGITSSVSVYNSKMTSGNMSLGYDNGIAGSLQYVSLSLNGNTTYTNSGVANLCESSGSTSTISLKDSSVFYSASQVYLGQNASSSGTLTVSNSAKVVVNAWFSVGSGGSTGSATFADNSSLSCGDFNVDDVNAGNATFIAQDNANIHCGNSWVGKGGGSTGYMLLTNNVTYLSDNGLTIGQGASSTAVVDFAGNSTMAVNLIQGSGGASSSILNFNGGTAIAHPPYFGNDFIFNLSFAQVFLGGAKIQINGTDSRNMSQPLLNGTGGADGGLTKLGTGTLLVDGACTFTGPTTVSAGTLGGIGSVIGSVSVPATTTLAPGDAAVGTFTIGGGLALNGTLAIVVNETNTPATNSVAAVAGAVTGSGKVTVINQGPALNVGDRFVIFSGGIGANSLTVPPSAGVTWNNNLASDGSISVATIIPPPAFATSNPVTVAPSGTTTISATGTVGGSYSLLGTTNLTLPLSSWTVISSGTITTSPFTVTDPSAAGLPQRFYIFRAP